MDARWCDACVDHTADLGKERVAKWIQVQQELPGPVEPTGTKGMAD